jgi:hypothetical protein
MFRFFRLIKAERGNSMLGLLAVMTVSLAVVSGLLGNAASTAKVKAITDERSDQFYEVENAIGKVNAWLQANSSKFIKAFEGAQFNSYFTAGSPTIGANETSEFSVPTQLKVYGTSNSVLLTNDSTFGTAAFPQTPMVGGGTFNAATAFASAFSKPNNVKVNVRAILVWAAQSGGDYAPIFRIDAITGNNPDRGVHAYAFSEATLETTDTESIPGLVSYYGKNAVTISGNGSVCSAKRYVKQGSGASATWVANTSQNGCVLASDGTTGNIALSGNASIQGAAKTLKVNGITTTGNANVNGKKAAQCNTPDCCKGPGCHAYTLPTFSSYATYCAARCSSYTPALSYSGNDPGGGTPPLDSAGCYTSISVSANRTLTLSGNNSGPVSTGYCIGTLSVSGNGKITLGDYTNAYYINNLTLSGNDAFKLGVPENEESKDVELYVGTFSMSGNASVNTTRKPLNLVINALNTSGTLSLSGNTIIRAILTAPGLGVSLSGNTQWHGSLRAKSITSSGNALMYYDQDFMESSGSSEIAGATFSLRKTSLRYR